MKCGGRFFEPRISRITRMARIFCEAVIREIQVIRAIRVKIRACWLALQRRKKAMIGRSGENRAAGRGAGAI